MAADTFRRTIPNGTGPVALFIDWDNFAIGLRQEMPERPADVGPILRWSRRFGPLVVCRAYGEWRDAAERLAIYNAGVEVVYAPVLPLGGSLMARDGGGAKSLADTAMAVDVAELLSMMPSLTTVIMATSDKDLIPVLRLAQRRGLNAIVVGSDRTAGALRDLADEFISYRQLLDLENTSAGPASRPVAVPPMRYPRAPRTATGHVPPALPAPEPRAARPHAAATAAPLAASPAVAAPRATPAITAAEPEESEDAAGGARRRRRGGRRRRAGELAAGDESTTTLSASLSETDNMGATAGKEEDAVAPDEAAAASAPAPDPGRLGEPNPVGADVRGVRASPGALMLDEPAPSAGEVRAAEGPTTAPGHLSEAERYPTPSFADGGQAASVLAEPAAQMTPPSRLNAGPLSPPRAPVVLPGERLKRAAAAPHAGATGAGTTAPAAAALTPAVPSRAPVSAQASPGSAGPSGGLEAGTEATSAGSPAEQEAAHPGAIAAATPEPGAASAGSGQAGEPDADAPGASGGSRRSRRRGGRGRSSGDAAGEPPASDAATGDAGSAIVGAGVDTAAANAGDRAEESAAPGEEAAGESAGEGGGGASSAGGPRRPRRRGGRGR